MAQKMYIKDGKLSRCKQIVIDEQVVFNPTAEQIAEAGWTEYVPPVVNEPAYVPTYEELVVEKIRVRYTVDDELALLRQRDVKPDEFAEYNAYCEACKAEARGETEGV